MGFRAPVLDLGLFLLFLTSGAAFRFSASPRPSRRAGLVIRSFDPRVSPHEYGQDGSESVVEEGIGVIVVDHGSKREAANDQLREVVEAVKRHSGHGPS